MKIEKKRFFMLLVLLSPGVRRLGLLIFFSNDSFVDRFNLKYFHT